MTAPGRPMATDSHDEGSGRPTEVPRSGSGALRRDRLKRALALPGWGPLPAAARPTEVERLGSGALRRDRLKRGLALPGWGPPQARPHMPRRPSKFSSKAHYPEERALVVTAVIFSVVTVAWRFLPPPPRVQLLAARSPPPTPSPVVLSEAVAAAAVVAASAVAVSANTVAIPTPPPRVHVPSVAVMMGGAAQSCRRRCWTRRPWPLPLPWLRDSHLALVCRSARSSP